MNLSFRPMIPEDYPRILDWLARPHVKAWWDDGDDTIEKVAQHYDLTAPGTARFILMIHPGESETPAVPIGYFQYYILPDGTIGTDQFIGEEQYLDRGMGTCALRHFVTLILERHRPGRIILDPSPQNARAIRCYEKVGFQHYAKVTAADGTAAYMMQLDPDAFRRDAPIYLAESEDHA